MAWNREKERKASKKLSIAGCIYGLIFSIAWCVLAAAMGGWFMLIFGIPFACLMGYRLALCLRLTKQDREQTEHPSVTYATGDPWDTPTTGPVTYRAPAAGGNYCPYCGSEIQSQFTYCPKCGRKLS